MTVTLHPRPGERMADLVRELARLADGDVGALRTGRSGVVVDDDLARAYLWAGRPDPMSLGPVAPQMVPPALRAVVRRAEAPLGPSAQTAGPPART